MQPVEAHGASSYCIPVDTEKARIEKLRQQLEMEYKICGICWTMYGTGTQPADCQICSDERQIGGRKLQRTWYTHSQLRSLSYKITIREVERDLLEICLHPLAQRCFLILSPTGNVLWGCTSYVDEATEEFIKRQGGIRAIAVSHPHELYAYALWAVVFNCPVYIHERDKDMIVCRSECIETWSTEEFEICSQIKLIRLGGHFDGGAILHWRNNATLQDSQGVVFCADMLQIGADNQTVSIMRSYSNFIPLSEADANRILCKMVCLEFDRIYASGNNRDLLANAKLLTIMSLEKYAESVHIPKEEKEEFRIRDLADASRDGRPLSPAAVSSNELSLPFREAVRIPASEYHTRQEDLRGDTLMAEAVVEDNEVHLDLDWCRDNGKLLKQLAEIQIKH